jgi:HTH-type transcriptional regulator / antitoxin HigA
MEEAFMKATKLTFKSLPKEYGALCRVFPPRPIRDQIDYQNVAEVADAMALHDDEFTKDQEDYFELLCSLIEAYDSKHVKWPAVSGTAVLKHLLEENGLTAADLSRLLGGSRNLGAMILRGDRNLTVGHIKILSERFRISADLLT